MFSVFEETMDAIDDGIRDEKYERQRGSVV